MAAGESAFAIVEQYQDAAGGYAGGNFPDAWISLEKRHEDKDTIDVADLKQAHYDIKMTKNEKPSFFIDKLKKMRKRLANEMKLTTSSLCWIHLPRCQSQRKRMVYLVRIKFKGD